MRARWVIAIGVASLAACSSKSSAPDAGACATVKEVDCDVTVTCAGNPSVTHVVLCEKSNDGPTIEKQANDQVAAETSCTGGELSFAATCTAPADAITCPMGFDLEMTTVCIPGMTYDTDTKSICSNLPADEGPCSVACNRVALYAFAVDGKFQTYTCGTADGKTQFVVGAAPMTGDGAR